MVCTGYVSYANCMCKILSVGQSLDATTSQASLANVMIMVNDICARYPDVEVLKKGVRVLMDRQFDNGDFPVVSRHSLSQSQCYTMYLYA